MGNPKSVVVRVSLVGDKEMGVMPIHCIVDDRGNGYDGSARIELGQAKEYEVERSFTISQNPFMPHRAIIHIELVDHRKKNP